MNAATERARVMDGMTAQFSPDYMHLHETDKQRVVHYIDELIAACSEQRAAKAATG
jgi:hypothetical protein